MSSKFLIKFVDRFRTRNFFKWERFLISVILLLERIRSSRWMRFSRPEIDVMLLRERGFYLVVKLMLALFVGWNLSVKIFQFTFK